MMDEEITKITRNMILFKNYFDINQIFSIYSSYSISCLSSNRPTTSCDEQFDSFLNTESRILNVYF